MENTKYKVFIYIKEYYRSDPRIISTVYIIDTLKRFITK